MCSQAYHGNGPTSWSLSALVSLPTAVMKCSDINLRQLRFTFLTFPGYSRHCRKSRCQRLEARTEIQYRHACLACSLLFAFMTFIKYSTYASVMVSFTFRLGFHTLINVMKHTHTHTYVATDQFNLILHCDNLPIRLYIVLKKIVEKDN